jgi:hypothetical protein
VLPAISRNQSAEAAANYLEAEIRQGVAGGAVRCKLVLQLAAPGDKIDDPSVAWASTNTCCTATVRGVQRLLRVRLGATRVEHNESASPP